ncbi:Spermatogenesis-associated protein 5 [Araneus ventricosus]|uniref:Spermatogenesis-associated protein 5 n=1 Tax=Araneus ventricosus TaxID=182803 RepID=A0A4Y2AQ14_ARAVE|nr:Spermatogenesis-associated protein 5 [Araneus ventricosus]
MVTINLAPLKGSFLPKQRQIIFLSPSRMKKFQLQRGSPVILTCVNGELLFRCWPKQTSKEPEPVSEKQKPTSEKQKPTSEKKKPTSENQNVEAAVLPAFAMFKHYTGLQQSINLFKGHVYEAEDVIFSVDKYRPFMDTEDFLLYLKRKLGYVYMKEGMILHLNYLGWPLSLTVQNIFSSFCENKEFDSENKNVSTFPFPSLEDSFSEKCIINKTFGFQSSTPVSSPRIQMHNNASKAFYFIGAKTRSVIQNPNLKRLKSMSKTKDIAGLDEQIDIIKSSINPLLNQDLAFGTRGILIIGPPGTGKTLLIDAIRNEYEHLLSLYNIKNVISCSGIEFLKKLLKKIENESPSLILIDDIDKLYKIKDQQNDLTSIIYKTLSSSAPILVIATCQNADSIPANLRKHGLLDEEIKFTIPSATDRVQITKKILGMYENDVTNDQICKISEKAHGFTGGDLKRLCHEAHLKAMEENPSDFHITFNHLQKSSDIKPSSMTTLSFVVPNVKWSDIGGMNDVKKAVKEMVDWPLKHPEKLKKFKIVPPRGILMYGPPGCSKTMIAKALASESQLNFITIKSGQVFNKYVGESEKSVSELFKKARAAAPCILFLDEVDSLVPVRGSTSGSSNVADRVVTQILVEIDGIDVLEQGVSVIAATNNPEKVDPSLLRPGRLDRLIYVPLPDAKTREEIFQVILRKKPISSDIDLQYLVNKTANYTGVEISAVCLEACTSAMNEAKFLSSTPLVSMRHFLTALRKDSTQPRTTQEMLDTFHNYHKKFQFKS